MRFLLHPARYTSIALATALLAQAAWITPARASNADEEDLQQAFGEPPMISVVTGTRQLVRRAPAVATVITKQAEEQGGRMTTKMDRYVSPISGYSTAMLPALDSLAKAPSDSHAMGSQHTNARRLTENAC